MKQLGKLDTLDWFLFALIILQAYWNYRNYIQNQNEKRIV